jgi:hypothetical protein
MNEPDVNIGDASRAGEHDDIVAPRIHLAISQDSRALASSPLPLPPPPSAVIRPQRKFSLAWLIPCAAVLFAGWLAYQAWLTRGVHITVEFDDGHGLAAGDLVRYRGTPIGEVRDVRLAEDMQSVIVDVALRSDAERLARAGSRFWIVRPQLRVDEIRGLETLIGPRYIAALPAEPTDSSVSHTTRDPGQEPTAGPIHSAAAPQYNFVGLPSAPIVERIEAGDLEIVVQSDALGSLRRGAPVLYRQVTVGTILAVGLSADGSAVEARLHIEKPFVSLIREHTRFWDAGGVRFDAGLTGLSLEMDSLAQLVTGAIALATPPIDQAGEIVRTGHRFTLAPKPDDDWLKWQAITMIGSELLPPGVQAPSPLRATVGWRQTRMLLFTSSKSRHGWVLPTREGLLGPADLLAPEVQAQTDTLVLEVAGQSITLPRPLLWSHEGMALIEAPLDQPLWRDAITDGDVSSRVASNADDRLGASPEDCLAFADSTTAPLPLSAARLVADGGSWRIDTALPVDEIWHGAPVLTRRDGKLIGMVLVRGREARVALLP